MKPIPFVTYLQSDEAYEKAWERLANAHKQKYEERIYKATDKLSAEGLKTAKELFRDRHKREPTKDEAENVYIELRQSGIIMVSAAIQATFNDRKEWTIREWKRKDRAKDKKIFKAKPFANITCDNCKSLMEYQWSDLDDILGKVHFVYKCPKGCKRKMIDEDGTSASSNISK